MAVPLSVFRTPADQASRDLAGDPAALDAFGALWTHYLDAISQQAIVGNPWQASNSSNTPYYFNPLTTALPRDARVQAVRWSAMPGRIAHHERAGGADALQRARIDQLADYGWTPSSTAPGRRTFRAPPAGGDAYGPYGPRGWQDEYCEWSVLRDPVTDKIVRIDFTCESPEYWFALWQVAPETVAELYRTTLDNPSIRLDDLILRDAAGRAVIDPSTGAPAYDPLNRWNRGPERWPGRDGGGAMHLTSTPNTLQTGIAGLAGVATIPRCGDPRDPEHLLCCARVGQPHRHSDPRIGRDVNALVAECRKITIADPPGFYLQMPDFGRYALPGHAPPGARPQHYWRVTRGALALDDAHGRPLPGNFILHAVFEVPAGLGFAIGDIRIDGEPIEYAAQVAATFEMQLNVAAIPAGRPLSRQGCAGEPPNPAPQPLQMWHAALWDAYSGKPAPANPVGVPMTLASNVALLPPAVRRGQARVPMALICRGANLGGPDGLPTVGFDGAPGSVRATVTGCRDDVVYTVPGDSYPTRNQVLSIDVTVDGAAVQGLRGVRIGNPGEAAGQAAPGFLRIE